MIVLYLIIEHFKGGDPLPVYRRFRDRGRLAPAGLEYMSSWVDVDLKQCFQLMETDDRNLIDEWIVQWSDLIEFEIYPVITSEKMRQMIAPDL